MNPVLQPEVLIAQAQNKFDTEGNLTDERSIDIIKKKIENLISACKV
ncbi:hypothetical protein HDC90_001835 [Pedobacter sp. AK013]|nr:hypothetical protein [Pedobacter sp. AK013]MBB6237215.1 hypothetical protein [Pedobacter sp. AK013]